MNTIKSLIVFTSATYLFFACTNEQKTVEQESSFIEITSQQFTTDKMELGKAQAKAFESKVKSNGTIVPLPNGMANVSVPVSGIIKSVNCYNGQSVEKNQLLVEITGKEIIELQKDFAEASANYNRSRNEFDRIKSLYEEKVTSEKDYILAKTDYITSMAMYKGLKLMIESVGLSVSKIEDGEFYSSYSIKSPIKGHVLNLQANIGSFIDSQNDFLEIINPEEFQVKLTVFASEISNLRIGQTVRFKSLNSQDFQFATLSSIGVAIDEETKSVDCYATLKKNQKLNQVAYEFVESEIVVSIRESYALPTEALIKTETGYVVLALEKEEGDTYFFKPVEVSVGEQQDGFTEIIDFDINSIVLTRGVYNINLD